MRQNILIGLMLLLAIMLPVSMLYAQDDDPTDPDTTITEEEVEEAAEDAVEATEDVAEATTEVADNILQQLTQLPENEVIRILMVIGGSVLLIAGWRVYDLLVVVLGAFVGGAVAVGLLPDAGAVLQILALLIGALIGAVIGIFLFYIAVFAIGAYGGLVLTQALAAGLNVEPVSAIILLVGAIIGGIILVALSGELLMIFSALVGAQLLVAALNLEPLWVVILAVVGIVIQLIAARQFGVNVRRKPDPRGVLRRSSS